MKTSLTSDARLERLIIAATLHSPEFSIPETKEELIEADCFTDPKYRSIFSAIHTIASRDGADMVDEMSVLTELDKEGLGNELKQIVLSISNDVDTSAMVGSWAKKLYRLYGQRELYKTAKQVAEAVTDPIRGVDGAKDLADKMSAQALKFSTGHIRGILKERRFDWTKKRERERPLYRLNGIEISHPGNLGIIKAQSKAGKSSFVAAGIASALNPGGGDFLGWTSENPEKRAILHIDTEQSLDDHDTMNRRILRRAGLNEAPDCLESYCLTGLDIKTCLGALELLLEETTRRHLGIHSVWLDGVADFVSSPNDEQESMSMVTRLHGLAIRYDTAIWGVLHLNPGSENKMRGHLGSQLDRKAEVVLAMEKSAEDQVTTVWTNPARRKEIPKWQGARFEWCDMLKMHVSANPLKEKKVDKEKFGW